MEEIKKNLEKLFGRTFNVRINGIVPLPVSGSDRRYFRIVGEKGTVIGVFGPDIKENKAFIAFTKHFGKHGLNVPEIFAVSEDERFYLQKDLGQVSLFSLLQKGGGGVNVSGRITLLYKKVLEELVKFQVSAGKDLDYSVCYPRDAFDERSMQWDLNYFKYYFLKFSGFTFDEQALENDFDSLKGFLSKAECNYFMYRDFQARNIMILNDEPWFIDYQGGRKGPLQYDLASLLFQAKAGLSFGFREEMLDYYLKTLKRYISVDQDGFKRLYYGFVLIRTLQVLGAYGFRGYFERKEHFLDSIDYARLNVKWLLENVRFPVAMPELSRCLENIAGGNGKSVVKMSGKKLTVEVTSFSYKNGIPDDKSGNGGGFVFDCRALPNPGRYDEYKNLTGKDEPVRKFLENETEVKSFLNNAFAIVDKSVEKYISRDFEHLMVNFGCTGGQHRSVYCAGQMANHLKSKYDINVVLIHTVINSW